MGPTLTRNALEEEEGEKKDGSASGALCDVSLPRGAGGYAGVGGGTYCPPPLSRQRKRRPTAEESRSRRKTRYSRRPPSERWGKGVAATDPTLNQAKAGALRGPTCGAFRCGWSGAWGGVGERQRGVLVADSLVGIHPHPGPTRRGVRSRIEGRRRRNEARREWRRRGVGTGVGILGLMALLLVVTWNVRRLSVRETNRRRMKSVAERVRQEGWEMVLLTELRADEEGVVWLGEDEERGGPVRRFASMRRGGGGYAGVGGGTYCPPPQSRQRKRRPTAEKSGSRRKTRHSRRPPSGGWGKGGGRPGPHPKPNKGWGPSGACMRRVPLGLVGCLGRGRGKTEGGVLVADSLGGSIPTLGLQEGELGAGGWVEEGEMRLGGKGEGGGSV